jgi:hypothetical protein
VKLFGVVRLGMLIITYSLVSHLCNNYIAILNEIGFSQFLILIKRVLHAGQSDGKHSLIELDVDLLLLLLLLQQLTQSLIEQRKKEIQIIEQFSINLTKNAQLCGFSTVTRKGFV